MKKTFSSMSPPPRVVVKKQNQKLVVPDQALTVTDILTRFKKSGNFGGIVQNNPQYPSQENLNHDSADFLKLSNADKPEKAELLKQTNRALAKAQRQQQAQAKAALEAAKNKAPEGPQA